jgi:hypothetical protein
MSLNKPTQAELDFAQELYLTATPDGRHKFSLAEISEQLEQKSNKKFGRSTILGWAKRHGWDGQFSQGVRLGTLQGLTPDSQADNSRVEQIQEALTQGIRYVCALQVEVAEKANTYLRSLGKNDRGVPRAAEAATKANLALMEMLTAANLTAEGEFIVIVESADEEEQLLPDQGSGGPAGIQAPDLSTALLSAPVV